MGIHLTQRRLLYLTFVGLVIVWLGINAGRIMGLLARNAGFLALNHAYAGKELTGELDEATAESSIASLNRAIARNAGNSSTWRALGYLYLARGEEAEALAAWQHTQITAAELLVNGGKAEAAGLYDEALMWYQRAVAVDPGLIAAWEGAGLIYERAGDWASAAAVYEAAGAAAPDNSDLLYHLGRARSQSGATVDWAALLSLVDRAISQDEFLQDWNRRQSHLLRAEALRNLDAPGPALAEYTWVLEHYPDDYWAALGRADLTWEVAQDAELAERLFQDAIAMDAGNKWGYRELAELYLALGRVDEARALYEHVLQIDPNDYAATRWLAQNQAP
jgi:tetratricopeptide (TPR) repeat protein